MPHTAVAISPRIEKGASSGSEASPLPSDSRDIARVAGECRKLVTRRALIAAGASVVPVPGVDVAVDISMLMKMLDQVNERFGLTPQQIDQLAPQRRLFAYKSAMAVGSAFIGRVITRELVLRLLKTVGLRLSARQAAKYVPFAGQAVAASLSFAALKALGDRHVEDCVRVAQTLSDLRDKDVVATF